MQEQDWLSVLSHLNLRSQYGEMLARTRGCLNDLDTASLALVANAALREHDTDVLAEAVPRLERLAPDLDTSLDIFFRDALLRGVRRDVAALQQQVGDFAPLIEDGAVDQAASMHLRAHAWRDLEYLLRRCAEDVDDLPSSLLRARAVMSLRRRHFGEAVVDAHAARDCARGDERTLCSALLARCLYRSGGIDKAARTYRSQLWAVPAHRRYHYLAALTAVQVERYPMARQMLKKAEQAGAEGPWVEYVRGCLALNANSAAEALEIFAELCARDPDNPRFLLGWLDAYDREAKPSDTLARLDRILERVETPALYLRRIDLLSTLGRAAEIQATLERALQAFPDDPQLRERMPSRGAEALAEQGEGAPPRAASSDAPATTSDGLSGGQTQPSVEEWPAEFQPRWTEADLRTRSRFGAGLAIQARVLNALMLREVQTQYGREKIGYLWAILEPAMHMAVFYTLWSFRGTTALDGLPLILFLITGFIPYFLFSQSYGSCVGSLFGGSNMLGHAVVAPIDLITVKGILELFTKIVVFVLFLFAVWLVGVNYQLFDPATVMFSFAVLWLFGLGLGFTVEAFSSILTSLPRIVSRMMRFLYFTSGVMYPISTMPPKIQDILYWNPLVHPITAIRYSFLPVGMPERVQFSYAISFMLGLLFFGLIALRALQRRLTSQ